MSNRRTINARAIDAAVRTTLAEAEPNTIAVPLIELPAVTPKSSRRRQSCAAQHFGPWNIWPRWMAQAAESIRKGTWQASIFDGEDWEDEGFAEYSIEGDGVAVIPVIGQITKSRSSFGGCSSVETRSAIRQAVRDAEVRSILLRIDSPGGTVAGMSELAEDVRRARAVKPVYAHVDDLACSAAYWLASQCRRISANENSLIGCIGTYVVLEDSSTAQERAGFTYRVVSTGAYKGLGADGKVSDLLVEDVQREVNELNQIFLRDVANGRRTDDATVSTWADGRSHAAAQALSLGLIDAVSTLDDAIEFASQFKESQMASPVTSPAKAGTVAERTARAADDIETPAPAEIDTESADYKAGYDAGYKAGWDAAKAEDAEEPAAPAEEAAKPAEPAVPAEQKPADASTSLPDLIAACEGDKATAADYAIAGLSVAQARSAYGAVKSAKAEAARKDAEIARLQFEQGGQKGVSATATPAASDAADPKAKAAAEWDGDPAVRKGFSSKENYVAVRSAELSGKLRVARTA